MRFRWSCVALLLCLQQSALPPEAAVIPVKVADLPGYSEGIVFDSNNIGYVSLLRRDVVLRLAPGKLPEEWLKAAEPNGHRIRPDGTHLVASRGAVLHVSPAGEVLDTLPKEAEGQALRAPNDLALDGHGGVYITDPSTLAEENRRMLGRVYYANAVGELTLAASDFCYPNGIVLRPDGRVLFVDDSCTSRVYAFDILAPGVLENRRVFAMLPDSGRAAVDGMTFDDEGRLYVAHYGAGKIEVLDSVGRLLRRYDAGNRLSSNVAFGGEGLSQLFVTGAPGEEGGPGVVYRLPLGVRGRSSRALPRREP